MTVFGAGGVSRKRKLSRDESIFLTGCGKAGNYSTYLQQAEQLRAKDEGLV
jgi:hypothetical protein